MVIRDKDELEAWLKNIAKFAVKEAKSAGALERLYQKDLKGRISQTVPHAKGDKKQKDEDDDSIFKDDNKSVTSKDNPFAGPASTKKKPTPKVDEPVSKDDSSDDTANVEKDIPNEISSDVIVDKLNVIRSGKSLKDPDVSSEMDEYINGLSEAERVALYSYMRSIGQIVAADADGSSVKEPDDEPYQVKMKRLKGLEDRRKEKQTEKSLATKQADRKVDNFSSEKRQVQSSKQTSRKGVEDRTPPIRVGKK